MTKRYYKRQYDYFTIGFACGEWRREQGIRQSRIAEDLDMTTATISNFECGKNNSASILMWYVLHGFSTSYYYKYLDGKGDEMTYYGKNKLC